MKPVIIAHRGASGRYPENTLEAIRAALRLQADGVEIDVQFSKDRKVMVIHDHTLDRTTNGTGRVQAYTSMELRRLRVGNRLDSASSQARIPFLHEVLEVMQPTKAALFIELKNFWTKQPGLEEEVIRLITLYDMRERVIISSFNFDSLLIVKSLAPDVTTGLLYAGPIRQPWTLARQYQADQIHAPADELTTRLIRESHANGFPVYGWTINEPARLRAVMAMGIDGVITDFPGRARKIRNRQNQANK